MPSPRQSSRYTWHAVISPPTSRARKIDQQQIHHSIRTLTLALRQRPTLPRRVHPHQNAQLLKYRQRAVCTAVFPRLVDIRSHVWYASREASCCGAGLGPASKIVCRGSGGRRFERTLSRRSVSVRMATRCAPRWPMSVASTSFTGTSVSTPDTRPCSRAAPRPNPALNNTHSEASSQTTDSVRLQTQAASYEPIWLASLFRRPSHRR
jgi:hypothetical protein